MNYKEEAIAAKEFFDSCLEILTKKANDYANYDDCFSNFKLISATSGLSVEDVMKVFLGVKLARLKELLGTGKDIQNESVVDTLKDMSNYACLTAMYLTTKDI